MILQKDTTIESFSIGNTTVKGSIKDDKVGKIFQLLSNLYSNREEIILQEVVANAQDSYIKINKEGVVNIKFDSSDRTLHIIDKAEGISPYVFENYITKLGSSSKENEDNSAGTLGVGGYAAWTLTNCYYLTTVYNGTKYIYSCTKRDYEEPEFNLLLEEKTEEENGTDYWFYLPNSTSNYRDTEKEKFEKALQKLRYFYNVTVEGLTFKNDYKIYQGRTFVFNEGYFNSTNDWNRDGRELEICFGNTPYPINWEKIDIPRIYIPVALKFELNEPLMILPSREALGWNNTTIECVKNKIIDFVEEITEIYKKQISPYNNILDYLEAINDKQKIKIGDSKINISCLKLESNLVYSRISHLDIKVPVDEDVIFENYTKFWNNKYTKRRSGTLKPNLWSNSKFYYSNEGLKKNKTSQIYYDCILKYEPFSEDFFFSPKRFIPSCSTLILTSTLPDNINDQIKEFYQYVKEDIELKFENYDNIISAKRTINTVKRTNHVYIAAFNGDTKKKDYNINTFIAPKYLFITDDKDEYNKIYRQVALFVKKTKDRKCNIVDVIYTAKKYHHLFSSCNIITLEEWFKSDIFINTFRRNIQRYNFKQLYNSYFFDWLKIFNKRLYFLHKDDKTHYDYNTIYQGLDLKIPYINNYQELNKVKMEYNKISDTNLYKKDKVIKFLRDKLTKCKK